MSKQTDWCDFLSHYSNEPYTTSMKRLIVHKESYTNYRRMRVLGS